MASSQSFSMIQRRISLSPEPASPVNSGEPLKTMPRRLPPFFGRLHLGDHVLEEQERAVVDARQAGAEPAAEALVLVLSFGSVLHRLPLHAERRIGQHVVELLPGKPSSVKLSPKWMFSRFWPLISMSEPQMA